MSARAREQMARIEASHPHEVPAASPYEGMRSGSEEGSYFRLIDFCFTQL